MKVTVSVDDEMRLGIVGDIIKHERRAISDDEFINIIVARVAYGLTNGHVSLTMHPDGDA